MWHVFPFCITFPTRITHMWLSWKNIQNNISMYTCSPIKGKCFFNWLKLHEARISECIIGILITYICCPLKILRKAQPKGWTTTKTWPPKTLKCSMSNRLVKFQLPRQAHQTSWRLVVNRKKLRQDLRYYWEFWRYANLNPFWVGWTKFLFYELGQQEQERGQGCVGNKCGQFLALTSKKWLFFWGMNTNTNKISKSYSVQQK